MQVCEVCMCLLRVCTAPCTQAPIAWWGHFCIVDPRASVCLSLCRGPQGDTSSKQEFMGVSSATCVCSCVHMCVHEPVNRMCLCVSVS